MDGCVNFQAPNFVPIGNLRGDHIPLLYHVSLLLLLLLLRLLLLLLLSSLIVSSDLPENLELDLFPHLGKHRQG